MGAAEGKKVGVYRVTSREALRERCQALLPLECTCTLGRDALCADEHPGRSAIDVTHRNVPLTGKAWRMAELVYLQLVLTNCALTY